MWTWTWDWNGNGNLLVGNWECDSRRVACAALSFVLETLIAGTHEPEVERGAAMLCLPCSPVLSCIFANGHALRRISYRTQYSMSVCQSLTQSPYQVYATPLTKPTVISPPFTLSQHLPEACSREIKRQTGLRTRTPRCPITLSIATQRPSTTRARTAGSQTR